MEQVQRPPFLHTRLGRVLLFVAVVWSVAASFVAIELVSIGGTDVLLASPKLGQTIGLSNATRDSTTCASAANGQPASEVRVAAWLLGLKSGRDSLARQYASVDRDTLARAWTDVMTLAQHLGVPPPQTFVPRHVADANTEYVAFVESSGNATARALAANHSSEVCHLFKLGALWGYASLVRPSLPGERAIFAAEIRYHAKDALPEDLWQPFTLSPASTSSADQIARADAATTERLTRHLGDMR